MREMLRVIVYVFLHSYPFEMTSSRSSYILRLDVIATHQFGCAQIVGS